MSKGLNQQECRKYLAAFADGELDVEQNLQVLEQMAMDPVNTKRVMHQQQLRQACCRVMDTEAMSCPDKLREKLRCLCDDANKKSQRASRPSVIARIGRWGGPLAVAALILFGVFVAIDAARPASYTSDGLISAGLAERFSDRHISCGMDPSLLHQTELFPAELDQLDESLVNRIGAEMLGASLDLSTIGYDYQVASICPIPGKNAVHLMYKDPQGMKLSLWIKPYDGQPLLDSGVPYIPPIEHSGRPMMVWRDGNVVFFLVGDKAEDVRSAQPQIHLAQRS